MQAQDRLLQRKAAGVNAGVVVGINDHGLPKEEYESYGDEQQNTYIESKRENDLEHREILRKQVDPRKSGLLFDKILEDGTEEDKKIEWIIIAVIFLLAAAVRFYKIDYPAGVVFDEVHFGKFASYYIRREYFFDVHPPLAKLLLAFAGWIIGYDGHYEFETIGESYVDNKVPYIGLRTLPAFLGSLIPPLVFMIMRESGYPRVVAILSASLILFDNAHVLQTKLILLDAPLILFMCCSFYAYIRFHKLRYSEFTKPWWTWMILTGVFLSLTISCKMVGLFAFMTVGTCVVIDLWNLLDIKRGLTIEHVAKHFFARAFGLIVVPAIVYLLCFWIHFAVLSKSGTGDDFMSPAFQQTLLDSPLTLNAEEVRYFDTLTFKHKATKAFLHSHPDRYPLKYDDGRISSAGQQVTGYPFNDTNNHWIIEPTKELPPTGRGRVVRQNDVVVLRHINTNTTLMTHDVACTTLSTNTEFTTWDGGENGRYEDTLFKIEIDDAHEGQQLMTKSSHFQLIHVDTKVAMWSHVDPFLPEWAYKQQEVNGNKNLKDRTTFWVAEDIIRDGNVTDILRPAPKEPKSVKKMNFFRKFFELQIAMLQHNAGLTDSHPYASGPINWPFLLSGISFWTSVEGKKEQVYLIGNIVCWWLCVMAMSIFVGVLGADQLAHRRGLQPIPKATRNRLYNSGGFFMIAWMYHYLPFFTMSRQLFLHHYLPAHVCSAMATGAVFHFIASETINFPISVAGPTTRRRPRQLAKVSTKMVVAVAVVILMEIVGFAFLAPLTYGTPGLEPDQVNRRRILSTWTLVSLLSASFFFVVVHALELPNLTGSLDTALRKIKSPGWVYPKTNLSHAVSSHI